MIVPSIGPRTARIALVGEAPGAEEERLGEPFVGSSGRLLNQMLATAGLSRESCYITNVVKRRPVGNNFGVFYEDKSQRQPTKELLAAQQFLIEELRAVHPNVIVPLGDEALRAVAGRSGITKWRGSILSTPNGKVIPTLHPAYVLRQYISRTIVELDLRRVSAESTFPEVRPVPHNFLIRPTFTQVMEFLSQHHPRLAFDIETTGPHVRCLGLASSGTDCICIPFTCNPTLAHPSDKVLLMVDPGSPFLGNYWKEHEELAILKELDRVMRDSSQEKIAQNYPFDSVVLARDFGIEIQGLEFDTMYAQHTCYSELPKGLDFLCSIYTKIPYYSDYDPGSDDGTWTYNCWDCVGTFQCAEALRKELLELGQDRFYREMVLPTMLAYTRMEQRGVLIDLPNREAQATKVEGELKALTAKLQSVVSPTFNPASTKQIQEYLYGKLRLPVQYNHKTKQPTADKNALDSLRKSHPAHGEFITDLLQHSKLDTLLTGFLRRPVGGDGRIRTHYNTAGTTTGRSSSSEPLFDVGTNLQNIPSREYPYLRQCFIAEPGRRLIKADLSQAEFRLVVWFARINRLIQKYQENPDFDVHRWVASLIFRVPEDQIKKEQRSLAKNGVYGGNYKMSYRRAAQTYHLDYQTAVFVLDSYRRAIPEIPVWWEEVNKQLASTRKLTNPFGRSRLFLDRMDDDLFRAGYADLPQSTVAWLINRAVMILEEILPEEECHLLMQVHDEVVLSCQEDRVDHYCQIVKNVLEYPIQFPGVPQPLVIPADIGVGKNWLDITKWKPAQLAKGA
jgi:uracil-DNA glycosylase family 4